MYFFWGLRIILNFAFLYSKEQVLKEMFPEGKQHITETTKRPITAGTSFKNSIIALVDILGCKVSV